MVIGIVCEFNPFHAGHKYLLDTVKSKKDYVICCMSSNFVQRGAFAVYDKFTRAKTAIKNGADLVVELPTVFSTLSAEGFAKSSIGLIENLNIVDSLAFGAECNDVEKLKNISEKISDSEIQNAIIEKMKSGISYPRARHEVLHTDLLNTSNNILAAEYLKFTKLRPIAVKRIGLGHDSADKIYSSSAIRETLTGYNVCSIKNCERAVLAKLRCMTKDDFKRIADVTEGLENRIYTAVHSSVSLDEIYAKIKTKRYTLSRIKRIILRSYLGIEGTQYDVPYIHVLGFNAGGRELLTEIKEKSSLPIITGLGDCSDDNIKFFKSECHFTDLFSLGYPVPHPCGTEEKQKMLVLS